MKIGIVFLFISFVVFSQNDISKTVVVQEIKYEYKIKDIADFVSYVPQIKTKSKLVQNEINRDIKKYFLATSQVDKATYTKNILKENKVKTVYEYKKRMDDERLEMLKDDPDYYEDQEDESYQVEYLSNNLLNISILNQIQPYRGQNMASYLILCYNLKTGKKLNFKDFFSIGEKELIKIMRSKGYSLEPLDEGKIKYEKISKDDTYPEDNIINRG